MDEGLSTGFHPRPLIRLGSENSGSEGQVIRGLSTAPIRQLFRKTRTLSHLSYNLPTIETSALKSPFSQITMASLRNALICLMASSTAIYAGHLKVVWPSGDFIQFLVLPVMGLAITTASQPSIVWARLSTSKLLLTNIHPVITLVTVASLPLRMTAEILHARSSSNLISEVTLRHARSRTAMAIASILGRERRIHLLLVSPLVQTLAVSSNSIPVATKTALLMMAADLFMLRRIK